MLDPVDWLAFVEACCGQLPGYVCLLLFDASPNSERLRAIIQRRYVDIDRITGSDLLVLSTTVPPDGWTDVQRDRLARLPDWAARIARRDLTLLGTPKGEQIARWNEAKLLREMFGWDGRIPAICYLWVDPAAAGGEPEIRGEVFDFSAFEDEEQVMAVFEYLGRRAEKSERSHDSTAAFAARVHSISNPTSLRWRAGFARVTNLFELVKKLWDSAMKEMAGSGDR